MIKDTSLSHIGFIKGYLQNRLKIEKLQLALSMMTNLKELIFEDFKDINFNYIGKFSTFLPAMTNLRRLKFIITHDEKKTFFSQDEFLKLAKLLPKLTNLSEFCIEDKVLSCYLDISLSSHIESIINCFKNDQVKRLKPLEITNLYWEDLDNVLNLEEMLQSHPDITS